MKHKQKIAEDVSLIVTTYNRPVFLELVLKSIIRQSLLPAEVVVADDGSGEETRKLIARYAKIFPVPLIHSWIPDEGFRLSKSRNIAIACSKGEYIISIDGDIVLARDFVRDHVQARRPGYFINGGRARLSKAATLIRCKTLNDHFSLMSRGLKRPLTMIRLPWLHSVLKGPEGVRKIRGCNMSFWRRDLIAANGFEEKIEGWGCEDTELVVRLYNNGVKRLNIPGLASCVHLYHPGAKDSKVTRVRNARIEDESAATKKKRADQGIDQYLPEK